MPGYHLLFKYLEKKKIIYLLFLICYFTVSIAQRKDPALNFIMYGDVKITLDVPSSYSSSKKTITILYALPNGNTTEQTMGKKMSEGDDWHFDIQHIKAQTKFIRSALPEQNIVVAYLENNFKSWPAWKAKHDNYAIEVKHIVDTLYNLFAAKQKNIYLTSHSGGGRFIFCYLDAVNKIPKYITNITFLDSDYGYNSTYLQKLEMWLQQNKNTRLNVFAYNDSVALLDGKRFVSDTGGTWYRSHMMINDLSNYFKFKKIKDDSLVIFRSTNNRITFNFKTNPDKKIFHTQQVELNGFIHAVLTGTKQESKNYIYFGVRAYGGLIE